MTIISPQAIYRVYQPSHPVQQGYPTVQNFTTLIPASQPDQLLHSSKRMSPVRFGQGFDFNEILKAYEALQGLQALMAEEYADGDKNYLKDNSETLSLPLAETLANRNLDKWRDPAFRKKAEDLWTSIFQQMNGSEQTRWIQARLQKFLHPDVSDKATLQTLLLNAIMLDALDIQTRLEPWTGAGGLYLAGMPIDWRQVIKTPADVKLAQTALLVPELFHIPEKIQKELEFVNEDMDRKSPQEILDVIKQEQQKPENGLNPAFLSDITMPFWNPDGSIKSEFGEKFDDWLGSASIAQVHLGMMRNGSKVAVKIIPDGRIDLVNQDIRYMQHLQPILRILVPEMNLAGLLQNTSTLLKTEVDMLKEAEMLVMAKHRYRRDRRIYVPDVYHDYTSTRVLTMSFVEAENLKLFKGNHDVAKAYYSVVMDQIFRYGLFQADPKEANMPYDKKKKQFGFIDAGEVREITIPEQVRFARLLIGYFMGDMEGLAATILCESERTYDNKATMKQIIEPIWKQNHEPQNIALFLAQVKAKASGKNLKTAEFNTLVWASLFCSDRVARRLLGNISDKEKTKTLSLITGRKLARVIWRHNPAYLPRAVWYGLKMVGLKVLEYLKQKFATPAQAGPTVASA